MTFQLFGIDFKISVPFAVIILFLLITDKTGLMSASLVAAAVHEVGHIVLMKKLSCAPRKIELIGGGALITGTAFCTFGENIAITVAGPAANVLTALLMLLFGHIFSNNTLYVFAAVQFAVGAVNLLPIKGLDGGELLKALLSNIFKTNIEMRFKLISVTFAVAVTVIGTAVAVKNVSNPSLLLLGIYLIIINILKS